MICRCDTRSGCANPTYGLSFHVRQRGTRVCFPSWSNWDRQQANGDIEWAAGKAMNGLTLAAQVAGVA